MADQEGSGLHNSGVAADVYGSRTGSGRGRSTDSGGFGHHEVYRIDGNYRQSIWPGDYLIH